MTKCAENHNKTKRDNTTSKVSTSRLSLTYCTSSRVSPSNIESEESPGKYYYIKTVGTGESLRDYQIPGLNQNN